MKLYDLVQRRGGKVTVVMTDTLPNVNAHKKKLRDSQRKGIKGRAVTYTVRPAEAATVKFKKKPVGWYQ